MPNITYTITVPNPPNLPSQDVGAMQTNTANIATFVAQDHYPFNDVGNRSGWHDTVTMQNQGTPALPGTMNGLLFCTGGNPWWVNAAAGSPFQIALVNQNNIVGNGYINLGGVIFQWGQIAQANVVTNPVVFPLIFPTNVFNIQVTTTRTNNSSPGGTFGYFVDNSSVLTTGFNIQNSSGHAYGYNWFAIGN